MANLGDLPGLAGGAALGVGALFERRVAAELVGFYEPPQVFRTVATKPGAGGRFSAAGASLHVGFPLGDRDFVFVPYAGTEYARIMGQGVGVIEARTGAADRWSIVAGAYAVGRLFSCVGLRAQVEAVVPMQRPEFDLEVYGRVYREPAAGGRALLGIVVSP
jgi:hypothetical protein